MEIVLATHNKHKIAEISEKLGNLWFYHKGKIIVAVLVLLAVILTVFILVTSIVLYHTCQSPIKKTARPSGRAVFNDVRW